MAQVLVRDLSDDVVGRLKVRARAHGRSLQAELRTILEEAAMWSREDLRQLADELAAATATRQHSDAVRLLREDRER